MPTEKAFRIAIARTGHFTDSQGRPQAFSKSDLDTIATSYDPSKLEAPLVFGHPRDNEPAFGWVTSLQREGQKLFAQFAQVPDTVRQLVHDGRYRYVSMSLMPDRKRLRHVALLGAAVPAIDGLGAVSMADCDDSVTVDFAITTGDVNMPTMEELQAKIAALEAENTALKLKLAETEKKEEEAKAEFSAYKNSVTQKTRETRLNALVKAGKVRPAERAGCLSFAAALAEVEKPVEFAAEDGKTENISAEERYFRELANRAPNGLITDFSALAVPGHAQQNPGPAFTPSDVTAKL